MKINKKIVGKTLVGLALIGMGTGGYFVRDFVENKKDIGEKTEIYINNLMDVSEEYPAQIDKFQESISVVNYHSSRLINDSNAYENSIERVSNMSPEYQRKFSDISLNIALISNPVDSIVSDISNQLTEHNYVIEPRDTLTTFQKFKSGVKEFFNYQK